MIYVIALARHFQHPDVGPVANKAIMGLACALLSLFLVVGVPYLSFERPGHGHPSKYRCIANLKQIDGAKQQWALENKKLSADIPAISDITPFLKNNVLPVCPDSGSYTLNAISADPTCTKATLGHTL